MNLNRDALIAYIYDLYSIEQAISQIENDISVLQTEKESILSEYKRKELQEKNAESQEIRELRRQYISSVPSGDSLRYYPKTFIFLFVFLAFFFIGLFLLKGIKESSSTALLWIWIIGSLLLFLVFFEMAYYERDNIYKQKIKIRDKKNSAMKPQIDKEELAVSKKTTEKLEAMKKAATSEMSKKDNLLEKQKKTLKEFEAVRFELYDKLQLIPSPHQNLYSVCYIYRYLTTSRESDLNYIFTQLNLEKIIDQLRQITESQKKLILIQRQILAEQKVQTALLGNLNVRLQSAQNDFNSVMSDIQNNMSDITDNQRAILKNQALFYRESMEKAKQQARSHEEMKDYMNMIEQNTKVTAMFKRAEFLGLTFDRNYSGNY